MALKTICAEAGETVIDRDRRVVILSMAGITVTRGVSEFQTLVAGRARGIPVLPCQFESGSGMAEFHRRSQVGPSRRRVAVAAFQPDVSMRGLLSNGVCSQEKNECCGKADPVNQRSPKLEGGNQSEWQSAHLVPMEMYFTTCLPFISTVG